MDDIEPSVGLVEFADLGALEVRSSTTHGSLGRRSAVALGALLWADRPVATDRLAEIVWGDNQPVDPREALHVLVWRLRRVLEPQRRRGEAPTLLVSTPSGYVLLARSEQVHSRRFISCVDDAQSYRTKDDTLGALERLDTGLSLWREHPLGDLGYESWARPHAAQLTEMLLFALELRLDLLADLGRDHDVVRETEGLVARHPTRECFWARRARALYRVGDQASALRTLHAARSYLGDELGVEPGPELVHLERQILDHDPELHLNSASCPDGPVLVRLDTSLDRGRRVPLYRSSFLGRDDVTSRVRDLLARNRLVTVTGPAGVGKTRLAIEAARTAAPAYDDGAVFVDLCRAVTAEDVAAIVAADLGFDSAPLADVTQQLSKGAELLVVLDNCEHVLAGVRAVVNAFGELGGVSTLATSRCPLGVDGEHVVMLPPLPVAPGPNADAANRSDPAVGLLMDRAIAAGATLGADQGSLAAIHTLATRLDGVPLALELAGASLASFELEDLLVMIDEGHSLPVAYGAAHPARHRTVEAAVEPSFDACGRSARELLVHLAALPGPFTLSAAKRVGARNANEGEVPDLLMELVHHGLVVHGAHSTYSVLFPTRALLRCHGGPSPWIERPNVVMDRANGDGADDVPADTHDPVPAGRATEAAAATVDATGSSM